jgi:hypothetical protein
MNYKRNDVLVGIAAAAFPVTSTNPCLKTLPVHAVTNKYDLGLHVAENRAVCCCLWRWELLQRAFVVTILCVRVYSINARIVNRVKLMDH